jgi:hypothetical protein
LGRQEPADFSVANTIDSPISFNLIGEKMASDEWNDGHKKERYEYNRKWYLANRPRLDKLKKLWKQNNKKKTSDINKNSRLKQRYHITLEQFNQMVLAQNGRCATCDKPFKNDKDTCVDHHHDTNKVRQLLCFNCNTMIGKIGESTLILQNMISYLNKWS